MKGDVIAGPELTFKKVVVLLMVALLILFLLFFARNPERREQPVQVVKSDTVDYLYISPYDSLFREAADSMFDWTLLAAIAYVESKFDTLSVSSRGAIGLMQIMPSTYKSMLHKMGVCDSLSSDTLCYSTEMNIKAAVFYLHSLNNRFHFINEKERLNYILGSYNSGPGYVFDAMRVARKRGVNRYSWNSLSTVLSRMNEEEYYSDSICKLGCFDATETLKYVRNVQDKYNEYRSNDLMYRAAHRLLQNQKVD